MMRDATVFVIDDDDGVRDGIGFLLDSVDIPHADFENADAFLAQFDPLKRGCLVLDIRMPGMSGLELQKELERQDAMIPIIFITGHGDIPMAVEAMRRGALDFIRKPFRDQELLDRIHEALSEDGERRQFAEDTVAAKKLVGELTPREHEVFERVCLGQANKVIAIELGISERTVEIHRSQVMHKTGAHSLAELVRLKIRVE